MILRRCSINKVNSTKLVNAMPALLGTVQCIFNENVLINFTKKHFAQSVRAREHSHIQSKPFAITSGCNVQCKPSKNQLQFQHIFHLFHTQRDNIVSVNVTFSSRISSTMLFTILLIILCKKFNNSGNYHEISDFPAFQISFQYQALWDSIQQKRLMLLSFRYRNGEKTMWKWETCHLICLYVGTKNEKR